MAHSTQNPIVFTGISLSHAQARLLLPATIRPPVQSGDLDQIADDTIVAIIDGILDESALLSVEETRRGLARRLRILGAASLGALRAFEVSAEGMEGCGWVYHAYRTGFIVGVDEIAVQIDPMTYQPHTVPLVDIRFCLRQLVRRRVIIPSQAEEAMQSLKSIPIEERTHQRIRIQLTHQFGSVVYRQDVKGPYATSIKTLDAFRLLKRLSSELRRNDDVLF